MTSCWTLWHGMLPRYQLTSRRDIRIDYDHHKLPPPQGRSTGTGTGIPSRASSAGTVTSRSSPQSRGTGTRIPPSRVFSTRATSHSSPRVRSSPCARCCTCASSVRERGRSGERARLTAPGIGGLLPEKELSERQRRLESPAPYLRGGVLPDRDLSGVKLSLENPVLSPRRFDNIMKNHERRIVKSAEQRTNRATFAMKTPTPTTSSPTNNTTTLLHTNPRQVLAATAPAFPITDPSNTDQYHRLTSPAVRPQKTATATLDRHDAGGAYIHAGHGASGTFWCGPPQRPQRSLSGKRTPHQWSSIGSGVGTRREGGVRTPCCSFGQTSEALSATTGEHGVSVSSRRFSPTQKNGDTRMADLHVDNSQVRIFRKTKPNVRQRTYSPKTPFKGSYLSHLRRVYLSDIRDIPKLMLKEPGLEKYSRKYVDCDSKVGRILDCYTTVDVPTGVHTPRPPNAHTSLTSPPAQHAFRTRSTYGVSPNRQVHSELRDSNPQITDTEIADRHDDFTNSRPPDRPRPSVREKGFLTFNAKVRLQNRHRSYLHTPACSHSKPTNDEVEKPTVCGCGMCPLEMGTACTAQLHQVLDGPVGATTAAPEEAVPEEAAPEEAAVNADYKPTPHARLDAVSGSFQCSAGPDSVNDSQRSESCVSVSQDLEAKTSFEQQPTSGPDMSTTTFEQQPTSGPDMSTTTFEQQPTSGPDMSTTTFEQQPTSGPDMSTTTQPASVTEITGVTINLPDTEDVNDVSFVIQKKQSSRCQKQQKTSRND
ncbi:hypothetical protein ACOMHN_050516 [Nucella lapillus]